VFGIVLARRNSVGPSLRQLRVRDDAATADEDSNCCSMVDVSATAASVSLLHAAVTVSRTDTGYQSNIMQTTSIQETASSTATAGIHCTQQHLAADYIDSCISIEDL